MNNETSMYSDEVLARYYNVLIRYDKKNGYKYVDYAIASMGNVFTSLEEPKARYYCARIVHLSVAYQKMDVIKKYVEKVRDFILSDMSEQIISAEWLLDANEYLILEAVKLLSEERYATFMHAAIPLYECIFRRQFSYHDLATTHIDKNGGSQQEKYSECLYEAIW